MPINQQITKKSPPTRRTKSASGTIGKSREALQRRGKIIAEQLISGASQQDALVAAGYTAATARSQGVAIMGNPVIRDTIDRCLDQAGLAEQQIAQRLANLADATKNTYISHNGKITATRTDPDNPVRLSTLALVTKLKGLHVDKSVNLNVNMDVQPIDLSRYGRQRRSEVVDKSVNLNVNNVNIDADMGVDNT